MNVITLTGRLTKDLELKTKQDGTGSYCFFCIAVDAGKDKNGDKQTDFIDCYTSGQPATFLTTYAKKGDLIEVTGRLHTSIREDADGNKTKRFTVMVNGAGLLSHRDRESNTSEGNAQEIKPKSKADSEADGLSLPFEL